MPYSEPPPSYTASPALSSSAPRLHTTDFETASIRSAAPSYHSTAAHPHSSAPPPLHHHHPHHDHNHNHSHDALRPTTHQPPSLAHFRNPQAHWSTVRSNPTARHYQQVAARRAEAQRLRDGQQLLEAVSREGDPFRAVRRVVEEREREEFGDDDAADGADGGEDLFAGAAAAAVGDGGGGGGAGAGAAVAVAGRRLRPLEDPGLVGEVAAKINRDERLRLGNEILVREDKRWDWLLDQMKDWEERDKSWKRFREDAELGPKTKLARRLMFGKGWRSRASHSLSASGGGC